MTKIKSFMLALLFSVPVWASNIVTVRSPYDHNHAGNAALHAIFAQANNTQSDFKFILSQNPGGQGLVAINQVAPQSDLALIHPSFVQNAVSGSINLDDWIPVAALGDACFLVISQNGSPTDGIKSLAKHKQPMLVGVVGLGSATHLMYLEIGDKLKLNLQPMLFKSAGEAGVTMVAQDELVSTVVNHAQFSVIKANKNKIEPIAAFCPLRHPQYPNIKTISEQGIQAPLVFNILVANKSMPAGRRETLTKILDSAIKQVGKDQIFSLSNFISPHNSNITIQEYYYQRISNMQKALQSHQDKLAIK